MIYFYPAFPFPRSNIKAAYLFDSTIAPIIMNKTGGDGRVSSLWFTGRFTHEVPYIPAAASVVPARLCAMVIAEMRETGGDCDGDE